MAEPKSTYIGGNLGSQGKTALVNATLALNAPHTLDCIRQVFIQLERERERAGVENFTYSDIQINIINREKKEAA